MDDLIVLLLALGLVVVTVMIHYETLRLTGLLVWRLAGPPRARSLAVIGGVFASHLLQVGLFALAYWGASLRPGLGKVTGTMEGGWIDYAYLSLSNFTTLGVGDLFVTGPLRLVAGVESLDGLVLITWSATFSYVSMQKGWSDHQQRPRLAERPNPPQPARARRPATAPGRTLGIRR